MTAAAVGYAQVRAWGAVTLGTTQTTVVRTTAWIVLCRLPAQRLTAAALARALPADQAGSGRARLTRVRRWWPGPPWAHTIVSPHCSGPRSCASQPGSPWWSPSIRRASGPGRSGWQAWACRAGRSLSDGP